MQGKPGVASPLINFLSFSLQLHNSFTLDICFS